MICFIWDCPNTITSFLPFSFAALVQSPALSRIMFIMKLLNILSQQICILGCCSVQRWCFVFLLLYSPCFHCLCIDGTRKWHCCECTGSETGAPEVQTANFLLSVQLHARQIHPWYFSFCLSWGKSNDTFKVCSTSQLNIWLQKWTIVFSSYSLTRSVSLRTV